MTELPKKVVVVGGGYIGTELGQIFHTYGADVTQVELFKVLGFVDREIVGRLMDTMNEEEGYSIQEGIAIKKVEKIGEKNFTVTFTDDSVKEGVECVMMTAGR